MTLDSFFHPRSIAVVGVSRSRTKLGTRIFENVRQAGFAGRLVAVNPRLRTIRGGEVAPSVRAILRPVDLAVIVTPAATVPAIVRDCGERRIRNVVVISAGFRESGPDGTQREDELRAIARRFRINLLGPNCLGFVHGGFRINASFGDALPPDGNVALISQSGATAVAIADWAREADVGFRAVVSLGNKAGLSEIETLQWFGKDPKTDAILLYLESCEQGKEFARIARQVTRRKPVVVLKAGVTTLGQKAARSHTGALASSSAVFAAALKSAGVVHVDRIEDLFDSATLFAHRRTLRGPHVAVVTNAGGPSIMATDALAGTALSLADLSATTTSALHKTLPAAASIGNPFDLLGDADEWRYRRTLDLLARDGGVDAVCVLLTSQVVTRGAATADEIIRFARRHPEIAVVTAFLGGRSVRAARTRLRQAGIPHFDYPEDAIAALDRLWRYETMRRERVRPSHPSRRVPRLSGHGLLFGPSVHRLLRRYGFRTTRETLVQTPTAAASAASSIGYPVVVKLLHHRFVHKARAGVVWPSVGSAAELRRILRSSARRIGSKLRADEGWLIQKLVSGRSEWFLGGLRDASFGPAILIGRGGTDVESERRIVTLVPPFSDATIRDAIRTTGSDIVGLDVPAIAQSVRGLEKLLFDHPTVREIDINPLLVGKRGHGAVVVDARMIVDEEVGGGG
ncbi:MAG: acetate--CoA ligase family protein [Candidatus Kerfeldbacteria bacterium]|nr:acetate--CoA ligase family protein [Candidatus Kerfeldbacteria bacterium]